VDVEGCNADTYKIREVTMEIFFPRDAMQCNLVTTYKLFRGVFIAKQ
jgi:hypothetical protein